MMFPLLGFQLPNRLNLCGTPRRIQSRECCGNDGQDERDGYVRNAEVCQSAHRFREQGPQTNQTKRREGESQAPARKPDNPRLNQALAEDRSAIGA
jgi:hypothetical protein